jgi:predicted 2-oxoglutarate/Fe(II)-dependent dioxygenase YbiX
LLGSSSSSSSSLLLATRQSAGSLPCVALQGHDFEGGTFCFQSGAEPLQVQPSAGMLLIYTADDSNVHSVQEVTAGERSTLTIWFTLHPEHQEDKKVRAGVGGT